MVFYLKGYFVVKKDHFQLKQLQNTSTDAFL